MFKNITFQVLKPHLIALAIFIALPLAYLSPALSGKILRQDDIIQGESKSYEIVNFRKETGEEPLWLGTMFSGMPAFQINIKHYGNLIQHVNGFVRSNLPETAGLFFLMLVNCYLMLIVLGVNPWLAIIGAITFAFSSGNVISIDAGHNSKINALAYAPGVLAGVFAGYRRSLLTGFSITAVATTLQLGANHFQITYYLILIIVLFGLIEFYNKLKSKELPDFFKRSAVLLLAGVLALGPNLSRLWTTYEYSAETIRGGKSELTEPDKERNKGLDKDYAMRWSYGKLETLTLLIPNFMGGASTEALSKNSNLAKKGIPEKFLGQIPTYWGTQPFTSGPIYQGAALIFLFVLGLFLLKGPIRTWALITSVVVIMLSWGKNFEIFSDLFFYYMPLYDKFRTPSMVLGLLGITFPLVAFLGLEKFLEDKKSLIKPALYSLGITAGVTFLFGILGAGSYDFNGGQDAQLKNVGWPIDALQDDRADMLKADAFRSIIFILLSFAAVFAYAKDKLKKEYLFVALGLFVTIDLWMVDKRYLNEDDFVSKSRYDQQFNPRQVDLQIKQDPQISFRVFDVTGSPFNDSFTSRFHKSVGGYHAAKLQRYQDLIERHISRNNQNVLNMLNTKYFIFPNRQTNQPAVQQNTEALGNAWFVNELKMVNNADEEIESLTDFNPKTTAIVDVRFNDYLDGYTPSNPEGSSITLTSYEPNHLIYESKVKGGEKFAVFSEIYYKGGKSDDWKVYVDGDLIENSHIRVNYVLRGMKVPDGNHTIEFKFEPKSYLLGNQISLASSILIILVVLGTVFIELRKNA